MTLSTYYISERPTYTVLGATSGIDLWDTQPTEVLPRILRSLIKSSLKTIEDVKLARHSTYILEEAIVAVALSATQASKKDKKAAQQYKLKKNFLTTLIKDVSVPSIVSCLGSFSLHSRRNAPALLNT